MLAAIFLKQKLVEQQYRFKCYTNYADIIELWQRGRVIKDPEKICSVRTSVKSANESLIFLFLNQNICCAYSKEPSQ